MLPSLHRELEHPVLSAVVALAVETARVASEHSSSAAVDKDHRVQLC
jgi:hypothetical protein